MRIEKISLRNYRQFSNIDILFHKSLDYDLQIIIGTNGTGKTNILNAINWCLYGDEPHRSKKSEGLPIPNIKAIEDVNNGEDIRVSLKVLAEIDQDIHTTFTREAVFRKIDDKNVSKQSLEFNVATNDETNNIKIFKNDEAESWVERTFPKGIREYFFFDLERLDSYFKEVTGQKIHHAIFQISQIDLLENQLARKINLLLKELTKEASLSSPKINEKAIELGKLQSSLRELDKRIEECKKQISIAKVKITEYDKKLIGIPDIEEIEKKRTKLIKEADETKDFLKKKKAEWKETLTDYGRIIMLWPAINMSSRIIAEKKRKNEIPPTIDKGLLEETLQSAICKICGSPMNDDTRKFVKRVLSDITISSDVATQLFNIHSSLHQCEESIKKYERQIRRFGEEIYRDEGNLVSIIQQIDEIERKMTGFDEELIAGWYIERKKFQDCHDLNQQRLGVLETQLVEGEKNESQLMEQLNNELNKDKRVTYLKKKIDFCTKSLELVNITIKSIIEETRKRIEENTKKHFFDLIWKKETFSDVEIREDYSINLIHSKGYPCLGTVSAGERELLALAFTLALHEISGFDAPILIDTPVARISDVHREKFAEVLLDISNNKQSILLFTPAEYSSEVSGFLDEKAGTRYSLKLSSSEKVALMEVL